MGEFADMALERAEMEVEIYDRYRYSNPATQYEHGLIDEYGNYYMQGEMKLTPPVSGGGATSIRSRMEAHFSKVNSVPVCPSCSVRMEKRSGKFGEFWGCTEFPRCKESKSI